MTDILTLTDIFKSFSALKVTDDVTLSVARGEALGIIGPNGAGKSTLFNLITGNIAPDSGQITFLGQDVMRRPAMERVRMGVGRSFQIPQPFDGLSVFENLLVSATAGRGQSEADVAELCADILTATGLMARANTLAGGLSLLDRKRLELARALATGPELLLLDEIAGGLTEAECHALVDTIRNVHARGVTIIWIEHVLHALNSVVTRLTVLDFGKLIGVGEPAAIMSSKEVREIYLGSTYDPSGNPRADGRLRRFQGAVRR
ncbi:MAG: ABC transporter ATP-binding protein [Roseinatronobacter sp.]